MTDQPMLDDVPSTQSLPAEPGGLGTNPINSGSIPIPSPGASGSLSQLNLGASGSLQQVNLGASGSLRQLPSTDTGAFSAINPNSTGGFTPIVSPGTGAIPLPSEQAFVLQTDQNTRASASSTRPIIVFDRVSKVYSAQPKKPALNNISMNISSGEFVFLVGHSGSGKSTFIRLINHEFTITSGRLVVAGEDLTTIKRWRIPYLRRNIGCVFQDFKLLPNKTAFQNVAFALQVIGKSKHIIRTQVPEVLRLVGLEDKINKYPDQLSGGEQQRVSIARAIVNRPPMLICDEPTGNLDPQTSLGIMRLLDRINRTGTTILVATHDREMVDSMRKRVVALENGFLVRDEDKGVYGLDA
ncbi:MAG: cell division ATP-binding protein FtsE [Coriobacteriales bacterium]|nr:cell division ATP-binding protein FtsE [Coriobacteriales bacterium]